MLYRIGLPSSVSDYLYLRGIEGMTRDGRLAMYGFVNALREYGDEAREICPRSVTDLSIFQLHWTFDAGPSIRTLDLYVDDSDAASGRLQVVYAEMIE